MGHYRIRFQIIYNLGHALFHSQYAIDKSYTIGVVTPFQSHSPRSENGEVAACPWTAEGPFSANGNPNFSSSGGDEWAILGELLTSSHLFHP